MGNWYKWGVYVGGEEGKRERGGGVGAIYIYNKNVLKNKEKPV